MRLKLNCMQGPSANSIFSTYIQLFYWCTVSSHSPDNNISFWGFDTKKMETSFICKNSCRTFPFWFRLFNSVRYLYTYIGLWYNSTESGEKKDEKKIVFSFSVFAISFIDRVHFIFLLDRIITLLHMQRTKYSCTLLSRVIFECIYAWVCAPSATFWIFWVNIWFVQILVKHRPKKEK